MIALACAVSSAPPLSDASGHSASSVEGPPPPCPLYSQQLEHKKKHFVCDGLLKLPREKTVKSRRGQWQRGRGNGGDGDKKVMMVQRDLMSVLMFIEDSTLAASSQEVKQHQKSTAKMEMDILGFELKISSGTLDLILKLVL